MTDPKSLANGMGVCNLAEKVLLAFLALSGIAACARRPLIWEDPVFFPRDSAPAIVPRDSTKQVRARVEAWLQRDSLCGVAENILGPVRYRAGWRTDGQGLFVSRSADGGVSWDEPVVVDTSGSRRHACRRPAIFADTMNRYLHLSYFVDVEESSGLYYTHSMRADKLAPTGEGMFEAPRAIVYGGLGVGAPGVASRGDTVVVAYEDPNSPRPTILLALSTTAGHSFDYRERVSPEGSRAARPTVRLGAGRVEVIWTHLGSDSIRAARRMGRFR
jgi:hypothetical protein